MRCLIFAALSVGIGVNGARAQQVPARELFEFPIGAVAEAPSLARLVAGGLWNPSAVALEHHPWRWHLSVAALNTPIAQGVSAQHLGGSHRLNSRLSVGGSFTHAQVSDLVRTGSDPVSDPLSGEIPYSTTMLSLVAAWRSGPAVTGVGLRYRRGAADVVRGSAVAGDLGVTLTRPFRTPLTIGASTFLMNLAGGRREPLGLSAAAEMRIRSDSSWQTGVGYSWQRTRGYGHEHYLFGTGRWNRLEARGGLAAYRTRISTTRRLRLGIGLQYARYLVGLGREESGAGLGASYQFTLTTMFK